MSYFPDLSPYTYTPGVSELVGQPTVNIGWLDNTMPYPRGETSLVFHEKLEELCVDEATVMHCCGIYICDFCEESLPAIEVRPKNRRVVCGNGEALVIGKSVIYIAPSLVHHYVTEHQYKPPDEFIEAVLTGPGPASEEHRRLRKALEL